MRLCHLNTGPSFPFWKLGKQWFHGYSALPLSMSLLPCVSLDSDCFFVWSDEERFQAEMAPDQGQKCCTGL